MKFMMAGLLLATSLSAVAHEPIVINQASELVPWCKSEAEALYIGQGYTPFQWTASYHDDSNILYVNGSLRVHGNDVAVNCKLARGARTDYIVVSIYDPMFKKGQSNP